MFVGGGERFCAFRKMDLAQRFRSRADLKSFRQERFHRAIAQLLQRSVNHRAQDTLRKSLRGWINRRNPAKMNRNLLIIFNHLELRMIHANPLTTKLWFTENNKPLTGRDHLLDVMQIEPSADEGLAERICIRFLQSRFEDFFPPAEATQLRLGHLPAETDCLIAFLTWETRKLATIFVASRKMRDQILHPLETKPTQWREFCARHPFQLGERL